MTPTITQILASSYASVQNDRNLPANQWAESAFLNELERQGMIERADLGPTIERTLDWRANTTMAVIGASDLATTSLATATDVITAASYNPAQVAGWVIWPKALDMKNPTVNQKIDVVKGLIANAFASHDDVLERTLFVTSSAGGDELQGLDNLIATDGLGTVGGINASTDAFWRNKVDGFTSGLDLEAGMESLWNRTEKGTGSQFKPTLIVSDGQAQALFASTQQTQQRFEGQDLKASFTTILFKTARSVYSKEAPAGKFYFIGNKSYRVFVSRDYYRAKGETMEIQGGTGYTFQVYTGIQATTSNRSRIGVLVKQ
jgi:hypothetical protein